MFAGFLFGVSVPIEKAELEVGIRISINSNKLIFHLFTRRLKFVFGPTDINAVVQSKLHGITPCILSDGDDSFLQSYRLRCEISSFAAARR